MKKVNFSTSIHATAQKVWQVLWNDVTYRKWTSFFSEGSYAVSDWKEGSKIQFLNNKGSGMFSVISECKPNEIMTFTHKGVVNNFEEQPLDDETKSWSGSKESYSLKEINGNTELYIKLDTTDEFLEYFHNTFVKALELVKKLAEEPIEITIETLIEAPTEKVWKIWTTPDHITKWSNASDDWHTPYAENDLRTGGKFLSRMEAKDKSFGFDFSGVYDEVKPNKLISYTIADGRKVKVQFMNEGKATKVTETFEAESENSLELQRGGWQAILDNFKKYTEKN